jgi:S1-C subfamily serine protease
MVAEVSYPSPGFSAGVYPGDLIISVQNLSLAKLTREQLAKALAPADSKPLSLVLVRSRKRFEVRLTPVTYGEALGGIGRKLTRLGAAPLHCRD